MPSDTSVSKAAADIGGGSLNLLPGKGRRRGNVRHRIGEIGFGVGASQTIHCGVVGAGGLLGSGV